MARWVVIVPGPNPQTHAERLIVVIGYGLLALVCLIAIVWMLWTDRRRR